MIFVLAAHATTFTLSFPERNAQRISVEATIEASGDTTTLFMPTWTPGSYLMREYARHVEGLEAVDAEGKPLDVRFGGKNRWEVDTDGLSVFVVRYRLHASAVSVRGNYVDDEVAVLNGASTFIVPIDRQGPYTVQIKRPLDWAATISGLGNQDRLETDDYDELVDTPIVVGNPVVTELDVEGVPHMLVDFPRRPEWDTAKAADAVKRVAQAQHDFWGQFPYERYVFLNWLAGGRGGLEHLDSTLMITGPTVTRDEEAFESWLGLVSHEHFHAWNVKRLRPEALGPFDYEQETFTPDLWVAEGFTSYYDDLLLVRAGLIDEEEWRKRMSRSLQRLAETPGRLEQPLSSASRNAWIKYYRPDENSVNTAVSYYTKGAVVGWLLDARIRSATQGERSLDDVMRLAYDRYSGDRGYTSEEFRALASDVAGEDLSADFRWWVDTASELDLTGPLQHFGLRIAPIEEELKPSLGLMLSGTEVTGVPRDTPAWNAGIVAGDELIGIDGRRFQSESNALAGRKAGDSMSVLIDRRGELLERTLEVGTARQPVKLEPDPDAKKKAKKRYERWLRIEQ